MLSNVTFSRRWSTPVSTVLRKSVTFFITNIFLIIKILSRLESGQYPVWMTMKSRKGDFKEWKSKKFPGGARLRTPLEACAFGARLGNRSVFILDPRLFSLGSSAAVFRFCFCFCFFFSLNTVRCVKFFKSLCQIKDCILFFLDQLSFSLKLLSK